MPSQRPSSKPSRLPSASPSALPTKVFIDYVKGLVDICINRIFVVAGCNCVDPLCVNTALAERCIFVEEFTNKPPKDKRRYKRLLGSRIKATCLDQLLNRQRTKVPTQSPSAEPSGIPSSSPSTAPSISASPSSAPSFTPVPTVSAQPSQFPSSTPSELPTALPSISPSALPSISSMPTNAPSRYMFNVKGCLRQVFLDSKCGCGPNGLTCFRKVNRNVCLVMYQTKNDLNTRDDVETFAEKTTIAYRKECKLRRRRDINPEAVVCLSCGRRNAR